MCGVYVRVCINMQNYIGGCGGIDPRKLDALRLLLRPFQGVDTRGALGASAPPDFGTYGT